MGNKREETKMQTEIANFWQSTTPGSETRKEFFKFMEKRNVSRPTVYRNMQAILSINKIPLYGWYKCVTDFLMEKSDG